jgi:N-acetylglutamate synthase-like GNAT family acetyltransferase
MSEAKPNVDSKKTSTEPKPKANIALRPYFAETDRKYVHYLFYSTYYNLVPRAVRLRIQSPFILAIWIAIYAYAIVTIPPFIGKLGLSTAVLIGVQFLITLVVLGGGLIGLLWYADKFDITPRVMEGIANDLREPGTYYRGTTEELRKGNFWVLTLNDEVVGCIGMDQNTSPVIDETSKHTPYIRASERPRAVDSPEIHRAEWKKTAIVLAHIDDLVRLTLVGALDLIRDAYYKVKGLNQVDVDAQKANEKKTVLFEPHKPTEASVRRLAVKLECQNHGLSTVLLKRVAFWAHAHQIEYLYADVDELQTKLAEILVKRHGYTFVSKKKLGYFKTKSTYKLDVKLWMSKELERRAEEKIIEDQLKEDAELKEYE